MRKLEGSNQPQHTGEDTDTATEEGDEGVVEIAQQDNIQATKTWIA